MPAVARKRHLRVVPPVRATVTPIKKVDKRVLPYAIEPTPKASKAQQFALRAEAAGWMVEREINGAKKRAICVRGNETVEVGWTNEVADGPIGIHRYEGGESPIKNAASALRIVEGKPGEQIPAPRVRAPRAKPMEPRKPLALRPGKLPFDPYTSTDEEVLAAVRGHKIVWISSLDPDNPCTGRVPNKPAPPAVNPKTGRLQGPATDYTTISLSKAEDTLAERILNFCDPIAGFRATFVGAIIRVGG